MPARLLRSDSPRSSCAPAPTLAKGLVSEEFLPARADQTGGELLPVTGTGALRETFVGIVDEFRTRYLLTYTPRGVDAGGWHPIEGRLKNGRGRVTARRGYLK